MKVGLLSSSTDPGKLLRTNARASNASSSWLMLHIVSPQHRRYNPSGGLYAKPITIGDDCWIAINAVILPGITIGAGSTIAAGAIVTKDVEEFTLVGGVPAKPIRRLTLDERSRELDGLNLGF